MDWFTSLPLVLGAVLSLVVPGDAGVVSVPVPGMVPLCLSCGLELVDPVRFTAFGSVVGVPGSVVDCCPTAVPIPINAPNVMIASFFISTSW